MSLSPDARFLRSNELATSFSRIVQQDPKKSLRFYEMAFCPQAVFASQQAVEKGTKILGHAVGFLGTNHAGLKASHMSLLGLLFRMPDMLDRIPALQRFSLKPWHLS